MLHMGHVLNNTIQDILARKARMDGKEVLWLPGTDHAGIATQAVVEKTLRKQGVMKHRDDLGREKFLEHVWAWKEKHGGIIIQQLKKLGCSCDWTRERFTMDPAYSRCVQKVFVELYKKGLIYRGKRMVNWDPAARTALSDEEVEMIEEKGHLWHLKYPLLDDKGQPKAGRIPGGRHHPPGDDARRRSRGGEPDRSALPAARRPPLPAALAEQAHPRHRRRAGGPEVRHRLREGDARPRPGRLRNGRCGTSCRSPSSSARTAR